LHICHSFHKLPDEVRAMTEADFVTALAYLDIIREENQNA